MACWLTVAEPGPPPPASGSPFLRFRDTTLGYRGPAADFTNLTEIRIGWFGPTNLDDPLTGDLWWAANQAVKEANEPAGNRRSDSGAPTSDGRRLPVRLIPRWSVNPWGTGVSQLMRMIYDEQPLALLGSVDSTSTHLAEQVVAKANLPLVSPIATDQSITLAGVSWMFSCAPSDAAIARALVESILRSEGAGGPAASPTGSPAAGSRPDPRSDSAVAGDSAGRRLVLLAGTDHDSRMTARDVLTEFSRRGRLPDFQFEVTPGATELAKLAQATARAKPAAVLIIARAEDAARLTRAVRDRLGTVTIFGSHSMGRRRFVELAGPAAEGVCFPLLFDPPRADADAAHFVECFAAEHPYPPDYAAALVYDATRLLVEAIRRAGPNRARIREALAQLSPWPGIAGPIQFDGTGQNSRINVRLATVRDGRILPLPVATLLHTITTNIAGICRQPPKPVH